MRILVITSMFPTDKRPVWGIAVAREVSALRDAGHEVRIVSKTPGWRGYLRQWRDSRAVVARWRPEVVHAHFGTSALVAALLGKRQRLVMTLHGSDVTYGPGFELSRHWLQYWASVAAGMRAHAIIVQASFMRDRLPRRLRPRAVVLPQAVEVTRFGSNAGNARDPRLILFLGDSKRPVKRRWLADQAVALVTDLDVTLVGLEEFAPEDIPRAMAGARLGLLTSEREGLPVACREALASGLPIVAVDLPGTRELHDLVPDGVTLAACTAADIAAALRLGVVATEGSRAVSLSTQLRGRTGELGWDPQHHRTVLLELYANGRRR